MDYLYSPLSCSPSLKFNHFTYNRVFPNRATHITYPTNTFQNQEEKKNVTNVGLIHQHIVIISEKNWRKAWTQPHITNKTPVKSLRRRKKMTKKRRAPHSLAGCSWFCCRLLDRLGICSMLIGQS